MKSQTDNLLKKIQANIETNMWTLASWSKSRDSDLPSQILIFLAIEFS